MTAMNETLWTIDGGRTGNGATLTVAWARQMLQETEERIAQAGERAESQEALESAVVLLARLAYGNRVGADVWELLAASAGEVMAVLPLPEAQGGMLARVFAADDLQRPSGCRIGEIRTLAAYLSTIAAASQAAGSLH